MGDKFDVKLLESVDLHGQPVVAVRKDTAVAVADADHYAPLLVDANGRLYVNIGSTVSLAADFAQLPAALAAHGGLKIEGVASGVAVPASDAGASWTSVRGVAGVPFNSADVHTTAAAVTDVPTSGQKLVITDLIVSVDTDMWVRFEEETSNAIVAGPYYLAARSVTQLTPRGKFKLATADKKLNVKTEKAGNITVSSYYYSEA
jgi:hypothetical protein